MIKQPFARAPIRCLYIGELTSGAESDSGLSLFRGSPGTDVTAFARREGEALWDQLQAALQRVRSAGPCAIAAVGTGCCAALALAEQLPVERLVLLDPALHPPAGADRDLRRIAGFARRNLSLCASGILVAGRLSARDGRTLRSAFLSAYSGLARVYGAENPGEELYTIREERVKPVVSHFLSTGELPKSLAENSEMCIIYG